MPIIIDDSQDLDQQLSQNIQQITLAQQVDAKYFSKSFTGSSKKSIGFFNIDSDPFNGFMKEKRRLLDNISTNHLKTHMELHFRHESLSTVVESSSKPKTVEFTKFETSMASIIPPIIFTQLLDDQDTLVLEMSRDTGLYNLNALETNWEKVTSGTIDGEPVTTYARPIIQAIRLYGNEKEVQTQTGGIRNEKRTSGELDVFIAVATIRDNMDKDGKMVFSNTVVNNGIQVDDKQGVVSIYSLYEKSRTEFNFERLESDLYDHLNHVIGNNSKSVHAITAHELSLILGDLSITETLKKEATTITHQSDEILSTFVNNLSKTYEQVSNDQTTYTDNNKVLLYKALIAFVQHLDTLNNIEDNIVSTDLLADIYSTLKLNISKHADISGIARHSLRLLLSQRLGELDEIKNNNGLYQFVERNQQAKTNMAANSNYSPQQKKIVTTTDPLVIGQAGAGAGKSHTLVGRIEYLREHGEDLSKALILSFTNVAAINITNRLPGVRSETLANMFHTIYSATFPMQSLSQPTTVANSLQLLNPASPYFKSLGLNEDELRIYINSFSNQLREFDQSGYKRVDLQQALKNMSNLIENNIEMTEHILNAVEQSTLELEPIIIHHKLLRGDTNLNIPQEYQDLNYIITDESQDISTFEYILLLELTIHYRSQLLIIGDGSQTLYEFRNSDPRYMNALEASGVFTSHKLETNYRSNEEILMFANQFLQVIDANKYANIQLKSSIFSKPTLKSLDELVKLQNVPLINGRRNDDYVKTIVEHFQTDTVFQNWFLDKIQKGEQVAIMGWTRKEVLAIGEVIQEILDANNLSNIEITNILSNNERPLTILSRFARSEGEYIKALDPMNPTYTQDMMSLIQRFINGVYTRSSTKQKQFYENIITNALTEITRTPEWLSKIHDYNQGHIPRNAFPALMGGMLLQGMLRAETRKNRTDQFLRKKKDTPHYSKCPIILSTIHGTKGLEFDNTVVLYNESKNGSTSQESMRMMFVALSRAKKSEFIINAHVDTPNRKVSDNLSAMHQTPMNTALMRTIKDVDALNNTP